MSMYDFALETVRAIRQAPIDGLEAALQSKKDKSGEETSQRMRFVQAPCLTLLCE